jgi:hypothetical protein
LIQAGASDHDNLYCEAVIDPGNPSLDTYADKGNVEGEREARLKGQAWRIHLQRKGSEDKSLSEVQEWRKKRIANPRARVERAFAGLA